MRSRRRQSVTPDGPRFAGTSLHTSTTRPAHAPEQQVTTRYTNTSRRSGSDLQAAMSANILPHGQMPAPQIKSFSMPKIGRTHE